MAHYRLPLPRRPYPVSPLFLPLVHGHRLTGLESDDHGAPGCQPRGRLLSPWRCLPLPSEPQASPRGFIGHAFWASPTRKRPSRPCLGHWPGMKPSLAWPRRHGVPCRPDSHRVMPGTGSCRAGPGRPISHIYSSLNWSSSIMDVFLERGLHSSHVVQSMGPQCSTLLFLDASLGP